MYNEILHGTYLTAIRTAMVRYTIQEFYYSDVISMIERIDESR